MKPFSVKKVKFDKSNKPMKGLTMSQKKELKKLSEYFQNIEENYQASASSGEMELDVFMSQYDDEGYSPYTTEQIDLTNTTRRRKEEFLKTGKDKAAKTITSKSR